MNIQVVEGPRTTWFTTLRRVKGELGITSDAQDERLSALIGEVSDDIAEFTMRPWARQSVTERLVGYGTTQSTLSITPIAERPSEVRYYDTAVSGYSVADAEAGFIIRPDRFAETRPYTTWVNTDPDVASQGERAWAFDYIGGYLMPGDDMLPSGIMSALAVDSSFNLTGVDTMETRFPLLVSGEYVVVAGFSISGNNGRFRVLSRTPSKLVVAGTLVDEMPSGVLSLRCRTLPRNLEGYAIEELRARWDRATRDPSLTSERIGDWGASYDNPANKDAEGLGGLSPRVARGLERYVRNE
jgi:hypothetical protein